MSHIDAVDCVLNIDYLYKFTFIMNFQYFRFIQSAKILYDIQRIRFRKKNSNARASKSEKSRFS